MTDIKNEATVTEKRASLLDDVEEEVVQPPKTRKELEKELFFDIRRHMDSLQITYEFTKDPKKLAEYYNLRERCYQVGLGLNSFSGAADEYDASGHILLAKDRGKIVAGARITASTPQHRVQLPLEEPGFVMKDLFPELDLEHKGYCEVSRFAISPEQRFTYCLEEMIQRLTDKSVELGCHYFFAVAPLVQARCYRKIHRGMGYDYRILSQVEVPPKPVYGGIKMSLSVSILIPEAADVKQTV